jgi:hypothetical protein
VLNKVILENAAARAVRFGTRAVVEEEPHPTLAEIQSEALAGTGALINFGSSEPAATALQLDGCETRGCRLQVQIEMSHHWLALFPDSRLAASATERYQ